MTQEMLNGVFSVAIVATIVGLQLCLADIMQTELEKEKLNNETQFFEQYLAAKKNGTLSSEMKSERINIVWYLLDRLQYFDTLPHFGGPDPFDDTSAEWTEWEAVERLPGNFSMMNAFYESFGKPFPDISTTDGYPMDRLQGSWKSGEEDQPQFGARTERSWGDLYIQNEPHGQDIFASHYWIMREEDQAKFDVPTSRHEFYGENVSHGQDAPEVHFMTWDRTTLILGDLKRSGLFNLFYSLGIECNVTECERLIDYLNSTALTSIWSMIYYKYNGVHDRAINEYLKANFTTSSFMRRLGINLRTVIELVRMQGDTVESFRLLDPLLHKASSDIIKIRSLKYLFEHGGFNVTDQKLLGAELYKSVAGGLRALLIYEPSREILMKLSWLWSRWLWD